MADIRVVEIFMDLLESDSKDEAQLLAGNLDAYNHSELFPGGQDGEYNVCVSGTLLHSVMQLLSHHIQP